MVCINNVHTNPIQKIARIFKVALYEFFLKNRIKRSLFQGHPSFFANQIVIDFPIKHKEF